MHHDPKQTTNTGCSAVRGYTIRGQQRDADGDPATLSRLLSDMDRTHDPGPRKGERWKTMAHAHRQGLFCYGGNVALAADIRSAIESPCEAHSREARPVSAAGCEAVDCVQPAAAVVSGSLLPGVDVIPAEHVSWRVIRRLRRHSREPHCRRSRLRAAQRQQAARSPRLCSLLRRQRGSRW